MTLTGAPWWYFLYFMAENLHKEKLFCVIDSRNEVPWALHPIEGPIWGKTYVPCVRAQCSKGKLALCLYLINGVRVEKAHSCLPVLKPAFAFLRLQFYLRDSTLKLILIITATSNTNTVLLQVPLSCLLKKCWLLANGEVPCWPLKKTQSLA